MKANLMQRLFIVVVAATLGACASMKSESPAPASKGAAAGGIPRGSQGKHACPENLELVGRNVAVGTQGDQ